MLTVCFVFRFRSPGRALLRSRWHHQQLCPVLQPSSQRQYRSHLFYLAKSERKSTGTVVFFYLFCYFAFLKEIFLLTFFLLCSLRSFLLFVFIRPFFVIFSCLVPFCLLFLLSFLCCSKIRTTAFFHETELANRRGKRYKEIKDKHRLLSLEVLCQINAFF